LSDDPAAKSDGARSPQDDEALKRVMRDVPRGALALSALTVGLLLVAWLLLYALVFLPRGMVS
jgi:cobalamin synthase